MRLALASALICGLALPAVASTTSHWTAAGETDFRKGRFDKVVATNLGDLKLSRAVKTLLEQDPRVSSIYALAEGPDGTIYAGTGPHGIVLQLKGEKVSTLLTLEDENIFSLLVDANGRLLIGTGGDSGRILSVRRPGEKPSEVFSAEGVQYVWQIRQTADGMLYAATGPNGQVFEIKPDGSRSVLLDSDENNILSLLADQGDLLYAGTDPNGLVYRINRRTREAFVLYDAPESEISAIALDGQGNLYVGTGQATDQENPPGSRAGAEKSGRPQGGDAGPSLPSPKPRQPAPPDLPKPNPSEPDPIPRMSGQFMFLDPAAEPGTDMPGPVAQAAPIPVQPSAMRAAQPPSAPPRMPGAGQQPFAGNAIYRIDPAGFVSEVFRRPGMVLSLVEKDGTLLVGTGSEGLIYQVNPAADEVVVLAKVDPRQVMSMLAARDGRVILGLANVGGLASMSSGYAAAGTWTSPVLDAAQISRFGKMHLRGTLPARTGLTIAMRSGNLHDPGGKGWSKWSEEIPASEYVQVPSPPARFLQYRLTFTSSDGTATAVVDEVDVAWRLPNLAPRVNSIRISSGAAPAGGMQGQRAAAPAASPQPQRNSIRTLAWEAADPDRDALEYTLYFRNGSRGPWILLEEELREPQFQWDTRTVPDGLYQVKVVASDARVNPRGEGSSGTRVSETVVVDNTSPVIGDVKLTRPKAGSVRIEARVVDRASAVTAVDYALDSKDDWQAVAASDKIFDSPEEGIALTLDDLPPGVHHVMLRATDDHGNQAYETVLVPPQ